MQRDTFGGAASRSDMDPNKQKPPVDEDANTELEMPAVKPRMDQRQTFKAPTKEEMRRALESEGDISPDDFVEDPDATVDTNTEEMEVLSMNDMDRKSRELVLDELAYDLIMKSNMKDLKNAQKIHDRIDVIDMVVRTLSEGADIDQSRADLEAFMNEIKGKKIQKVREIALAFEKKYLPAKMQRMAEEASTIYEKEDVEALTQEMNAANDLMDTGDFQNAIIQSIDAAGPALEGMREDWLGALEANEDGAGYESAIGATSSVLESVAGTAAAQIEANELYDYITFFTDAVVRDPNSPLAANEKDASLSLEELREKASALRSLETQQKATEESGVDLPPDSEFMGDRNVRDLLSESVQADFDKLVELRNNPPEGLKDSPERWALVNLYDRSASIDGEQIEMGNFDDLLDELMELDGDVKGTAAWSLAAHELDSQIADGTMRTFAEGKRDFDRIKQENAPTQEMDALTDESDGVDMFIDPTSKDAEVELNDDIAPVRPGRGNRRADKAASPLGMPASPVRARARHNEQARPFDEAAARMEMEPLIEEELDPVSKDIRPAAGKGRRDVAPGAAPYSVPMGGGARTAKLNERARLFDAEAEEMEANPLIGEEVEGVADHAVIAGGRGKHARPEAESPMAPRMGGVGRTARHREGDAARAAALAENPDTQPSPELQVADLEDRRTMSRIEGLRNYVRTNQESLSAGGDYDSLLEVLDINPQDYILLQSDAENAGWWKKRQANKELKRLDALLKQAEDLQRSSNVVVRKPLGTENPRPGKEASPGSVEF